MAPFLLNSFAMYWLFATLALGLPWIILIQTPPINSLANEAVAALGWGLLVVWISRRKDLTSPPLAGYIAYIPLGILLALALMAGIHFSMNHFPYPALLLIYSSYLIGAALVFQISARWAFNKNNLLQFLDIFAIVWILAATLNAIYGLYQYFNPTGHYPWIAALSDVGRIYGNTRQPNHYASLMIVAIGCTLWLLFERHKLTWKIAAPLVIIFVLGVALSGSRTGIVGLLFIASSVFFLKWGNLKDQFITAISLVILLGLFYVALAVVSEHGLRPHFGSQRLQQLQGDYSGSRFTAWATSWEMILENAWIGVGVGRFQFHYLLGDWSQQQGQHFGHAHNLFLHMAAENGLVMTSLAFIAMAVYCFVMLKKSWHAPEARLFIAFVGPLMIHSFFEFPLWHAFFLLPCFFLMGVLSGISVKRVSVGHRQNRFFLVTGGFLMVTIPLVLLWSQRTGSPMYESTETPISQRIMLAQNSFLFRHFADHALLITSHPEISYSAEASPVYHAVAQVLFDDRLAYHWALQSLAIGNLEQAKRLSYALVHINPKLFEDLKASVHYAANRKIAGAKEFTDYLNNPVRTDYSLDQLLAPN